MSEKFRELLTKHTNWLKASIREIEANLDQLSCNTRHTEASNNAISLAHQIHGTSGSYGFGKISEHARKLEDALVGVDFSAAAIDPNLLEEPIAAFFRLKVLANELSPTDSAFYYKNIS